MKSGREHRVALSTAAIAVLERVAGLRTSAAPDAFVFPGDRSGKPLSIMALNMLMRRLNKIGPGEPPPWRDRRGQTVVPHGFRSTFTDWAREATSFSNALSEAALAHAIRDKTEAAYARRGMLEPRRRMMEAWAAFCAVPIGAGSAISLAPVPAE